MYMRRQGGFSLIELMVVIGIMSIAVLGVMTMMDNQNKDFKFLAEKFEIRDTKSVLTGVIDENSFCGCLMNGKTLDTTTGLLSSGVTSVPISYTNPGCVASTLKVIPVVGSKLSASSNIEVASITMLPATEVVSGSGKYSTQLEVKFNNVSRSVRPMTVPLFFKIDTAAGSPSARPFSTCMSAAATVDVPPVQGFCTPREDWDNSNSLVCPAMPGYTMQRLTGVYATGTWWRGSGCCYIPDSEGGNGWCGPQYPSWNGSFVTCGPGNAYYTAVRIQGTKSAEYDQSQCCFVPKMLPKNPQPFSMQGHIDAWDWGSPNCGGPYTHFNAIYHNTVTAGEGRNITCSWVPKY